MDNKAIIKIFVQQPVINEENIEKTADYPAPNVFPNQYTESLSGFQQYIKLTGDTTKSAAKYA
jgi:hypothetical protein